MKLSKIRSDLNNPVFQKQLFDLTKEKQTGILSSLRKLSNMTWEQVYQDSGLKWEVILSHPGPHGQQIYSLRIGKGLRAVAYREQDWLRLLSLHPDHDSAYK
jgi:hypothetical protein